MASYDFSNLIFNYSPEVVSLQPLKKRKYLESIETL
jgi:hypothetical protein